MATSICSFVRKLLKEPCPSDIVYRLGKRSSGESLDIKVFDGNDSEVLDKPVRQFVVEIVSLILDSGVRLL